jgi:hypothetical protein
VIVTRDGMTIPLVGDLDFGTQRLDQIHDQAPKAAIETWRTFLRNHAEAIAAIDFCVHGSRSASAALVCGDPAADSGVAGGTDCRGISVGHGAELPDP